MQLYYQIAVHGRRDLPLAPDEYAGFTMALMRMLAFRPGGESDALPEPATTDARDESTSRVTRSSDVPTDDWPKLVRELKVTGATRQLAERSELGSFHDHRIELRLPSDAKYLAEKIYVDKLKAALQERLGTPVAVSVRIGETSGKSVAALEEGERNVRQKQANASIQGDAFVRDLVEQFGGSVVDASIKPNT